MEILACFFAILIASIGGHCLIFPAMRCLKKRYETKPEDKEGQELAAWLGGVERVLYVAAWFLGHPQFIGLWLTIKVVGNWKLWQTAEDGKEGRRRFNIFLIGSGFPFLSLLL